MLCDYCGLSKIHYDHSRCSWKMWLEDTGQDLDDRLKVVASAADPWAAMLLGEEGDTPGEVPC
jgi:hypothetical protein